MKIMLSKYMMMRKINLDAAPREGIMFRENFDRRVSDYE